jgi:hypothetical protein
MTDVPVVLLCRWLVGYADVGAASDKQKEQVGAAEWQAGLGQVTLTCNLSRAIWHGRHEWVNVNLFSCGSNY